VAKVMASYRNAGFFVLRTPLLPYRSFFELSGGVLAKEAFDDGDGGLAAELAGERRRVIVSLARAARSAAVREALFVASPDLHRALEEWDRGGLGEEAERKAIHALYRYVARMATRSTPFGLFAGSSIGALRSRSTLALAGQGDYRRFTLLDNSYLFLLLEEINADPAYRAVATYRPNSGLYRAGGRLRYAETLVEREQGIMSYQLASLDRDECIDLVLELARDGATIPALAGRLASACGVAPAEAREYLDVLVDNQVLVSALSLAVTGPDPLEDACAEAGVHPDPDLRASLSRVRERLADVDRAGIGCAPGSYRPIVVELERLPVADLEPSRLFQVDLWKPLAGDALGSQVVSDVRAVIAELHRIAAPLPRTDLDRLREAFAERYGDRSVPLTTALDPELGIAGRETRIASEATRLLEGLTFGEPAPADGREEESLSDRELFLLDRLRGVWSRGEHELVLGEADLEQLELPHDRAPLPSSFAAWFHLARRHDAPGENGEEYEVLFSAAVGPPCSRLLGRFAHGSARLTELFRELAEQEARAEPDAVLAEIAHLPEGRAGNVVCRPAVRAFEIPYLGKSGAARDRQIPIDDLWLRLEAGRFVLESRALGRRVLPRLSCAHNTDNNTVPLYRFLSRLQFQDCNSWLSWSWDRLLHASHLPRVRIGPVIVSRETWTLTRRDLEPLADRSPVARYRHVRALRRTYGLPRFLSLADGDNQLAIDLENTVGIDVLADMVRSRPRARLVELWPAPDRAGVEGPEGRYAGEVVLPFVRAPSVSAARSVSTVAPSTVAVASAPRVFGPGSEWLCARLVTGRSSVDQLLAGAVSDAAAALTGEAACDLWYFDCARGAGEWHIALHVHGEPDRLASAALPALGRVLGPLLVDGPLRAWSLDTTCPDTARWGGERAMREAQAVFAGDSAAAVALIGELLADGDEELRWQLAMLSADRLLADLAPSPGERRAAADLLRSARLAALPVGDRIESELARTCRARAEQARSILDGTGLARAGAILARRSRALEPACERLRALRRDDELTCPWPVLVGRLAESAARRLLRPAAEAHELVIYDLLRRSYRSEEARIGLGIGLAAPGAGADAIPTARRAAP
jgi:lantibiotic biosynthesis protein